MVVYISVGVFCGSEFEKLNTNPEYVGANFVFGFVISVLLLALTHGIWGLIRILIED
jgi:hypothetical protein